MFNCYFGESSYIFWVNSLLIRIIFFNWLINDLGCKLDKEIKIRIKPEMMGVSEFFGDEVVFDSVSSYLTISDLLKLSQVSRQVRQVV